MQRFIREMLLEKKTTIAGILVSSNLLLRAEPAGFLLFVFKIKQTCTFKQSAKERLDYTF
ncbi:MAG: hypothetical protein A2052_02730 [Deltaproteobacteria bacterium GWA2_54_12]|nr:MAG: hypothetical protein A2052_02730 [Deltaproteobacteria bacterium GWA2_54_12]